MALCDTFAQLEHEPAIGKLNQTLELRHRRVQTEAAAALARLNDESGKKVLIQLAEQPVARLRVLAYAEELGIKDAISLEFQGEIAMAESHLAIWLAEPAQMGLAPSGLKFLESRELYWPSYEHPVHCYLFEYHYGSDDQMHRNIGISGPLTHAFAADLKHLEVDEIYAAFAGWQTIHHEIYQISLHRAQQTFSNEYRRLISNLEAEAYDEHQPLTAASFFGELLLIADATKNGQKGTAIVEANQTIWFSEGNAEARCSGGCRPVHARTIHRAMRHNLPLSPHPDALPDPDPVHRLDFRTSGLLLVARTATARAELSRTFEARRIFKRYRAVVVGAPAPPAPCGGGGF